MYPNGSTDNTRRIKTHQFQNSVIIFGFVRFKLCNEMMSEFQNNEEKAALMLGFEPTISR